MRIEDLRIGSLVSYNNCDLKVTALGSRSDIIGLERHPLTAFNRVSPIPLSEEWLLKFGFIEQIGFIKFIGKKYTNSFEVSNNDLDKWYCYFRNFNKSELDDFVLLMNDLKYVHQLQNLYHALTGKDL